MGSFASNSLERSLTPNLLDPRFDHDSCGVGFVATLRNQPTHEILTQALTALARLAHRGAIAADGKSSDGVGIMTAVPRQFLLDSTGLSLDAGQPLGVGVVFFPSESGPGQEALERALAAQNLEVLAWRVVPTREEVLGEIALSSIPVIRQVLVTAGDPAHFERRLYLVRKQFERDTHASGYVCSLSSSTLVYKAMCAGRLLAEFYPDLADPNYVTPFAIFHQRYATNVLPSWDRAQPLRTLAHNGEINTVWGNRGRMDARAATIPAECHPILSEDGSDSTSLDEVVELLARNGRSVAEAVRMLLPPAGRQKESAFLRYHADCVEPWDGPAALAFADGHLVGVALDRNGLRPCRFFLTEDALVVAGSEAGLVDLDPERIIHSGRLGPGEMLVADLDAHQLLEDDLLLKEFDRFTTYGKLVEDIPLEPVAYTSAVEELNQLQQVFGYTREDVRMVLAPMASDGPAGACAAAGVRLLPAEVCPGHQPSDRPGARIHCHPVTHPFRTVAAHPRYQGAYSRAFTGVALSVSGPDARPAQSRACLSGRDAAGGPGLCLRPLVQPAPGDRRSLCARH
jgi:glutamate synthase (ferredoxin)